jgi:superfamily I DNA and/or RNA helicase
MIWGQHRLPLLLHGPPGTGKTKTLVEGVLQLCKQHPHAHILLCGASNPSTDTLALRLRSHMTPKSLFRLNSPSRPFAEVRPELLPFCEVQGEKFGLPSMSCVHLSSFPSFLPLCRPSSWTNSFFPRRELLQKRVICCTLLDASLLLNARVTNHDLSTLEIFIQGSIHPSLSTTGELPLAKPHFSYLLVDEAAQATEVDIGAALVQFLPPYPFFPL